jgi:hypothetical protein
MGDADVNWRWAPVPLSWNGSCRLSIIIHQHLDVRAGLSGKTQRIQGTQRIQSWWNVAMSFFPASSTIP